MKKNMVYFVLYILILVELLIVITERDELQEADDLLRDKMLSTLVEMYKQPLLLSIPQRESSYELGSKAPMKVVLTPAGLVSENEKDNLNFVIDVAGGNRPPGWPAGGITVSNSNDNYKIERENGNAVFIANLKNPGEYKFRAYCEVERELPDYLPPHLIESLKSMVGELKTVQSEKEGFSITAKSLGGVQSKKAEVSF
jgi:hypothetical protein